MTIIATPGAADANSYCTLVEATAFLVGHPDEATWTAASAAAQEFALLRATRLMEQQVAWYGTMYNFQVQALGWPQAGEQDLYGRYIFGVTTIPEIIKRSEAEYAVTLLREDALVFPEAEIFDAVAIGDIRLTFQKGSTGTRQLPAHTRMPLPIRQMLEPYGRILGSAGNVRVLRT